MTSKKTRISSVSNPATATTTTIVEYFQGVWNNQPATVIGVDEATAILLGFLIFLKDKVQYHLMNKLLDTIFIL